MKAGRNDRCPCGSGRKYKRCHLDQDRALERERRLVAGSRLLDAVTAKIATAPAGFKDFQELIDGPAKGPRSSMVDRIGEGRQGREAAELIEWYLGELERVMAVIAQCHSRAYWMHLVSRLQPLPLDGDWPQWSALLARRILVLAVLKHGLAEPNEKEFEVDEGPLRMTRVPVELSDEDLLDVYRLDLLSVEYYGATAAYRRVGKGAELLKYGERFQAKASAELQDLIRVLDERMSKFDSLTGRYGAYVDYEGISDQPDRDLPVFVPMPNGEGTVPERLAEALGIEFALPPNFLPNALGLSGFRAILSKFDPEIRTAVGVGPDDLLAALWAISANLVGTPEPHPLSVAQVLGTGYYPVTDERFPAEIELLAPHFAAWVREFHGEELRHEQASERLRSALSSWTYDEEDLNGISLWDRLPYKVLIPGDGVTLFNLAATPAALSSLMREVGFLDGRAGNVKAVDFEDRVEEQASEAGFTCWQKRRTLTAQDGAQREVDVAFVVGETLFVVECKAFAQNPKIDRGDFAALKGRRSTLQRYLQQAKTLAEFLNEHREGRNFEVPASIRRIEHLLVTPAVEWIWSRDSDLWVNGEIPRICTIEEMLVLFDEARAIL